MPSVKTPSAPTDHYTIISADCHAGGSHAMYREYLEPEVPRRLRRVAQQVQEPVPRPAATAAASATGTTSGATATRSPTASSARSSSRTPCRRSSRASCCSRAPPKPDEYEHRLAGIRAHNRWLADFCGEFPERRAGIGQIFLNDVDDAIDDVQWIKEHGLRGGVLLPTIPPDVDVREAAVRPGLRPAVEGVRGPRRAGQQPRRHRPARLRQVPGRRRCSTSPRCRSTRSARSCSCCSSGVFERFPNLKFVMTEMGCAWLPPMLAQLRRAARADPQDRVAPASCATPTSTSCRSRRPSTSTRTAGSA